MDTVDTKSETRDETGASLAKSLAGDDFPSKLDALFQRHFHGTRMGNDTELWGQCVAFREAVRELHAQL